jgi:GT2 family glycosyltransferase
LLERTVPALLASTGVLLDVALVDTGGRRELEAWIDEAGLASVRCVDPGHGAGFCRAVNAGYAVVGGDFVLLMNDDVLVTPTYLSTLVELFARRPRAGLATGKLLRYDFRTGRPTGAIDSAGLASRRNRRFYDRGAGEPDRGQFEEEAEVFGVSGAALVGRRSALAEAELDGRLLDEDLFMYKEDVDLSWRLRLLGWEAWYVPEAVAHHGRTSRAPTARYVADLRGFHRAERAKPQYVRFHSLKNQWLVLVANEDAANFVRDAPFIVARELAVLGYNLVLAPRTLLALRDFVRALPRALVKRRIVRSRRRVPPAELRRWLVQRDRAGPAEARPRARQ